ncbi:MAG: hypothetical protein H0T18_01615 [Chloroflexia bacterium]|nr:hypothetical protein [Chloroflexia bacterium]
MTTLVESVAAACVEAGCSLLGGETAEMPDVYPPGEFDVAGFIIGVLDRAEIGANGVPEVGDVVVGLPSSGLHTNGYSLARRALPYDTWNTVDAELGMTIGDALLVPHRSYLPEIQSLTGAGARVFAHITGGAHPENIARVIPDHLTAEIDTRTWEPPVMFRRIASGGAVSPEEMYRVFNMGIGLVAIVPAGRTNDGLAAAPGATVIGQIVPRGDGEAVRLLGLDG